MARLSEDPALEAAAQMFEAGEATNQPDEPAVEARVQPEAEPISSPSAAPSAPEPAPPVRQGTLAVRLRQAIEGRDDALNRIDEVVDTQMDVAVEQDAEARRLRELAEEADRRKAAAKLAVRAAAANVASAPESSEEEQPEVVQSEAATPAESSTETTVVLGSPPVTVGVVAEDEEDEEESVTAKGLFAGLVAASAAVLSFLLAVRLVGWIERSTANEFDAVIPQEFWRGFMTLAEFLLAIIAAAIVGAMVFYGIRDRGDK